MNDTFDLYTICTEKIFYSVFFHPGLPYEYEYEYLTELMSSLPLLS